MDPQTGIDVFKTVSGAGPWGLAIFLVLVNITTSYLIFKFFQKQIDTKDGIIKAFSDAWDRQTAAFNRRTRSENSRTEMEALQFAARPDLHPELKSAANEVIRRVKEDLAEEQ